MRFACLLRDDWPLARAWAWESGWERWRQAETESEGFEISRLATSGRVRISDGRRIPVCLGRYLRRTSFELRNGCKLKRPSLCPRGGARARPWLEQDRKGRH